MYFFHFSKRKTIQSEVEPDLLVIQIKIQAVWADTNTAKKIK